MGLGGVTAVEIEAAARRQRRAASLRGEAKAGRFCRRTHQVDPTLYHNARVANQAVYGVDNIWDEPEFVEDMSRRHPEIRVRSDSVMVGVAGVGGSGVGKLIRGLGRVTWSKRY